MTSRHGMFACTIVARNYLPMARVLAESFLTHHPHARFAVLVIDDVDNSVDERAEPFEVVRPDMINLSGRELRHMAMMYGVTELATAVKPWLLRFLLANHPSGVLYFDPDILVFGSLEDLAELTEEHSIVLTPHTVVPMARDQLRPGEDEVLRAGTYNLGFIGVGPGSEVFLDWWLSRLSRHAIIDPDRMLFTDQRWIDFVPGYFRHHLVRDDTCNVAYWNVDRRSLKLTGTRYEINGKPLRFFHFSGFEPNRKYLLSKHTGDLPRIQLSEHPDLAQLCSEYASKLAAAGHGTDPSTYGFAAMANGLPIDAQMRRAYRQGVLEAELTGTPEPPDPFDPQTVQTFLDWLAEPVGHDSRLSRYLYELYLMRRDLREAFPMVPGRDTKRYVYWVTSWGATESDIPDVLVPAAPAAPPAPSQLSPGINLVGYFKAEAGVGEAGRAMLEAVRAADLPVATVLYDRTPTRQEHPFPTTAAEPVYDTNLVCVNADELPQFAETAGAGLLADRHTIGYWHWEVEAFPASMHGAFQFVDEVWVASTFIKRALRRVSPKPVFACPLPIRIPSPSSLTRADLGLSEQFLFLFMFDFLSVFERKNPLGLVDAFRRAFPPGEGPVLMLKAINGQYRLADLEQLRAAVGQHPDVVLLSEHVSVEHRDALLQVCDCYVSLHRSEGFGLTMAEAMAAGKPVIATNYGGNLEFMDETNSLLVPYCMSAIPPGSDPYPTTAEWAEPDIDAAARLMRLVYDDREHAESLGRKARQDIVTKSSPRVIATFVRDRFDAIHEAAPGGTLKPRGSYELPASGSVTLRLARVAVRVERATTRSPAWLSPVALVARRVMRKPYRWLMKVAGVHSQTSSPRRHGARK